MVAVDGLWAVIMAEMRRILRNVVCVVMALYVMRSRCNARAILLVELKNTGEKGTKLGWPGTWDHFPLLMIG